MNHACAPLFSPLSFPSDPPRAPVHASTYPPYQGTVHSEADRAAGVDPSSQHDQETTTSQNPLVTSASFQPTRANVPAMALGDSAGSLGESFHDSAAGVGSDASWSQQKTSLITAAGLTASAGLGGAAGLFAAGGGSSGGLGLGRGEASGRDIGSAAAALAEDNSSGRDATAGSDFGGTQHSALSYRTEESVGGQSTSTLGALEAKAEAEAYEAELAASSASAPGVGTGRIGGPAVAAAAAAGLPRAGLPPSGRSSGATGVKSSGQRSRTESVGSQEVELRELTDQERQQRMEESDAARAASLLRGSSFKVPLQPDLEKKITEEEQERRRQAVQAVEASLAPTATVDPTASAAAATGDADEPTSATGGAKGQTAPSPAGGSPPSSLIDKVVAGMGMGRFFGMEGGRSPTSAEPTARPPGEEFKAGPAEGPARAAGGVPVSAGADYVPVTGEGAMLGGEGVGPATVPPAEGPEGPSAVAAGATVAGIAAIGAAAAADRRQKAGAPSEEATQPAATVEGSLSPEEVKAYSENVDRTLEVSQSSDSSESSDKNLVDFAGVSCPHALQLFSTNRGCRVFFLFGDRGSCNS